MKGSQMAKKVNREELLDVFKSDIAGAVIISKDTYSGNVYIVPAICGIKTYIGCIEFGFGDRCDETYDDAAGDWDMPSQLMAMSKSQCKEIYKDIPNDGTAWLVTPGDRNYLWERIDHLLRFQNEEDEEDDNFDIDALYEKRLNLREGQLI